jgi:hypothetical protein
MQTVHHKITLIKAKTGQQFTIEEPDFIKIKQIQKDNIFHCDYYDIYRNGELIERGTLHSI